MTNFREVSAISDTYSDDFDDNVDSDTFAQNTPKFHNDSRLRRHTPSIKFNRPEGHVRVMTMKRASKMRNTGGANSMPMLLREKESGRESLFVKRKATNRHISYESEKLHPKDRVLSSSLKTIRGLQSALKEKAAIVEELIKENKILKRNEILIVKDFAKLEKEQKTLPETLKRHEADIILQKEKQRKVMQEHLNAVRRKDQLETELGNTKQQLLKLKKISENKNLEERHELSLRLKDEMDKNQTLQMRYRDLEKKADLNHKSFKRECAELEHKLKDREKRVLDTENINLHLTNELKTKTKQLEKLNLYSMRIEKNTSGNLSEMLTSYEDKETMTSLEFQKDIPKKAKTTTNITSEPQTFPLPPTINTSNTVLKRNSTYILPRTHEPNTAVSDLASQEASIPSNRPELTNVVDRRSNETPKTPSFTHLDTVNITSSGNKSFDDTPKIIAIAQKEFISPEISNSQLINSSLYNNSASLENGQSFNDNNTINNNNNNNSNNNNNNNQTKRKTTPTQSTSRNSSVAKSSDRNAILSQFKLQDARPPPVMDPEKKEALLKNLRAIDNSTNSNINEVPNPIGTLFPAATQSHIETLEANNTISENNFSTFDNKSSSNIDSAIENLGSTQFESQVKVAKKRKPFILDDLFSDKPKKSTSNAENSNDINNINNNHAKTDIQINKTSPKSEETKFKRPPRQIKKVDSTNTVYDKRVSPNRIAKQLPNINNNNNNNNNNNVFLDEHSPHIVENMYQGKPAYSTEDDYYGIKHSTTIQSDIISNKPPVCGRRANENENDYYWEHQTPTVNTNQNSSVKHVDEFLDDDLEVIQL